MVFQGSMPYLVVQHEEMNYVFCISKTVNKLKREHFYHSLETVLMRVYHILISNQ